MVAINNLTIKDYINYIGKVLPEYFGNYITISQVKKGCTNTVFNVKTETGSFFIKQFNPILKSYQLDIDYLHSTTEVRAIELFEKIHRKYLGKSFVPQIIYHDTQNNTIILSDVSFEGDLLQYDFYNRVFDKKVASDLGTLMGILHYETYSSATTLGIPIFESRIIDYERQKKCLDWYKLLDTDNTSIINELLESEQKSVIYGDITPFNILRGHDNQVRLIDFGAARLDDPAIDLAHCASHYVIAMHYDFSFRDDVLDCLGILFHSYSKYMDKKAADKILERTFNYIGAMIFYRINCSARRECIENVSNMGNLKLIAERMMTGKCKILDDVLKK